MSKILFCHSSITKNAPVSKTETWQTLNLLQFWNRFGKIKFGISLEKSNLEKSNLEWISIWNRDDFGIVSKKQLFKKTVCLKMRFVHFD